MRFYRIIHDIEMESDLPFHDLTIGVGAAGGVVATGGWEVGGGVGAVNGGSEGGFTKGGDW